MLWLAAYLTGFPPVGLHALRLTHGLAPMWSGLYLISTCNTKNKIAPQIQVSMPSRAYTSFLLEGIGFAKEVPMMCQCPLGLIPHFYVPLQKPRFYAVFRACFCRYLSEYSDNSRFSCMLTFWTYLMRYTYPLHWIKYSTNHNRFHLIFSLSC